MSDGLRALADEWDAAAVQIGERALVGDPGAALATVNTLEACAAALRAAIDEDDPPLLREFKAHLSEAFAGVESIAGETPYGYWQRVAAESVRLALAARLRDLP